MREKILHGLAFVVAYPALWLLFSDPLHAEPFRQLWQAPPPVECADPIECAGPSFDGNFCGMGGEVAVPIVLAWAAARKWRGASRPRSRAAR